MRDPMTLIARLPFGINLWHVDPEADGSDDSCGWFSMKPMDYYTVLFAEREAANALLDAIEEEA